MKTEVSTEVFISTPILNVKFTANSRALIFLEF